MLKQVQKLHLMILMKMSSILSKVKLPYLLLLPGFLFLFTFFILPIVNLAQTSTQTPIAGGDTGEYEQTLRFANYIDAFVENREQFARSFIFAIFATLLALAIAYPLAYAIAFKSGRFKNVLLVLIIAPFFTSFLLRTVAWKQILGEEGFVVPPLRTLGIIGESTTLTSTSLAVVLGMTYNFLPFMTLPLYASLERIDPRTMEASGDLYANGITTFRRVTLPLSMPGVVAGTLLTFIPAAGDYVNATILGNPNSKMLGNVIESRYFRIVDYPTAAALSFTLMAAILILVTLYIRKAGTEELV
jgi:spermidine/putrescine transport system permease protein